MVETGQRPACDCPRPSGQHDAACAKYGKVKAMVETPEQFQNRMASLVGFFAHVDAIKARDAAIAHEARVGVLRDVLADAEDMVHSSCRTPVGVAARRVAARHNITPAELEPPKR